MEFSGAVLYFAAAASFQPPRSIQIGDAGERDFSLIHIATSGVVHPFRDVPRQSLIAWQITRLTKIIMAAQQTLSSAQQPADIYGGGKTTTTLRVALPRFFHPQI